MDGLYVVVRPFKDGGNYYAAGTLVRDLTKLKSAKYRIRERHMVAVPKEGKELNIIKDVLKYRYGVDLDEKLKALEPKAPLSAEPEATVAQAKPHPGTPKPLSGRQTVRRAQPSPQTRK